MTPVTNVILLVLIGLCFLGALVLGIRALSSRSKVSRQAYDVGQVEAKRQTQANLVLAGFLTILGLVFLGVYGIVSGTETVDTLPPVEPVAPLLPSPEVETDQPLPGSAQQLPNVEVTTAVLTPTDEVVPTSGPVVPTSGPTETPPAPTDTPVPSATPTPAPVTAVVGAGVGIWLRASPSTTAEQLEWLLEGSVVTLLDGLETADDLLWQEVRAESGAEGWVAAEFLVNDESP